MLPDTSPWVQALLARYARVVPSVHLEDHIRRRVLLAVILQADLLSAHQRLPVLTIRSQELALLSNAVSATTVPSVHRRAPVVCLDMPVLQDLAARLLWALPVALGGSVTLPTCTVCVLWDRTESSLPDSRPTTRARNVSQDFTVLQTVWLK